MKISDLYTKVVTEAYGTMEFCGLRDNDIHWLLETQTETLPARDFTVSLIQNQLITPPLDIKTVNGWSDDFLLFIASEWLKQQRHGKALQTTSSFEEFKEGVYTYRDELMKGSRELFEAFSTNLKSIMMPILPEIGSAASVLTHLPNYTDFFINQTSAAAQLATAWSSQMDGIVTSIESVTKGVLSSTELINGAIADIGVNKLGFAVSELVTQSIFDTLPDFTEWEEIAKEMQESDKAFRASGYSFIAQFISYDSVRRFASINIKVRNAAITNTMAATTRQKEFEEQLREKFQQSSVLSRRWKIVKQALDAHRERKYNLSVPALLAQVEGIIGDALLLKKIVRRVGNTLYVLENGKIKEGKKGDRVKANGLDALIKHSKWKDHETLQGVAELITSRLAKERNGVLHGRKIDYGTAKLSAQGLLVLHVLSSVFADLENSQP